ncbi:MAG: RdgB/HAM1 family non-canonical purine NTP pyrophosphatase [Bacteroidetes bacterium]|nr:RdgB/HAM1 family non-canonical purine NTP pyrophosphatase [Bacteroidota bacterium]
MTLTFATNNPHKLKEIRAVLAGLDDVPAIQSLADIGCSEEIPETAATLECNAFQKAAFIVERYGLDCFADDTGLEIEALDGRPGVFSARYAGEGCNFDDNIDKVLLELEGKSNRKAKFRTVICLILRGQTRYFEGGVQGEILPHRRGIDGFGYDPVFLPDRYQTTFAEMDLEEKNMISHRGEAIRKLVSFLRENQ